MRVQLENGRIVTVPDGISASEQLAMIDKMTAPPPAPPPPLTYGERFSGHLTKGLGDMFSTAGNILDLIPGFDEKVFTGLGQRIKASDVAQKVIQQPPEGFWPSVGWGLVEFAPQLPLYAGGEAAALQTMRAVPYLSKVPAALKAVKGGKYIPEVPKAMGRAAIAGATVGTLGAEPGSGVVGSLKHGAEEAVGFAGAVGAFGTLFRLLGAGGRGLIRAHMDRIAKADQARIADLIKQLEALPGREERQKLFMREMDAWGRELPEFTAEPRIREEFEEPFQYGEPPPPRGGPPPPPTAPAAGGEGTSVQNLKVGGQPAGAPQGEVITEDIISDQLTNIVSKGLQNEFDAINLFLLELRRQLGVADDQIFRDFADTPGFAEALYDVREAFHRGATVEQVQTLATRFVESIRSKGYDKENIPRLGSAEREVEAAGRTIPDEGVGEEKAGAGRILQTQEEIEAEVERTSKAFSDLPMYQDREKLYAERNEMDFVEEAQRDDAFYERRNAISAEIDRLTEEIYKTPESEAFVKAYEARSKIRTRAELDAQKEQDLANREKWESGPAHGTDDMELAKILDEGLNPGSALDYTPDRSWAREYPIQVLVPSAWKGRKIEHNNYFKSANRARVAKVIVDMEQYTAEAEPKIRQLIKELQAKHPDVEFEIKEGVVEPPKPEPTRVTRRKKAKGSPEWREFSAQRTALRKQYEEEGMSKAEADAMVDLMMDEFEWFGGRGLGDRWELRRMGYSVKEALSMPQEEVDLILSGMKGPEKLTEENLLKWQEQEAKIAETQRQRKSAAGGKHKGDEKETLVTAGEDFITVAEAKEMIKVLKAQIELMQPKVVKAGEEARPAGQGRHGDVVILDRETHPEAFAEAESAEAEALRAQRRAKAEAEEILRKGRYAKGPQKPLPDMLPEDRPEVLAELEKKPPTRRAKKGEKKTEYPKTEEELQEQNRKTNEEIQRIAKAEETGEVGEAEPKPAAKPTRKLETAEDYEAFLAEEGLGAEVKPVDDAIGGEEWNPLWKDQRGFLLVDLTPLAQVYEKAVDVLRKVPDHIESLNKIARGIVFEGKRAFADFKTRFKAVVGELWEGLKTQVRQLWKAAVDWNKRIGERGRVGRPILDMERFEASVKGRPSVDYKESRIMSHIIDTFLKGKVDADISYSEGKWWRGLEHRPTYKFDKYPSGPDVTYADTGEKLPVDNASLFSIFWDPPFMTRQRAKLPTGEIAKKLEERFTAEMTPQELHQYYKNTILESFRANKKGGYFVVKVQDSTRAGGRPLVSNEGAVLRHAEDAGYKLMWRYRLVNTQGTPLALSARAGRGKLVDVSYFVFRKPHRTSGTTLSFMGTGEFEKLTSQILTHPQIMRLYSVGSNVMAKGARSFEAFTKRMGELLGEWWESIKGAARQLWQSLVDMNKRMGEGGYIAWESAGRFAEKERGGRTETFMESLGRQVRGARDAARVKWEKSPFGKQPVRDINTLRDVEAHMEEGKYDIDQKAAKAIATLSGEDVKLYDMTETMGPDVIRGVHWLKPTLNVFASHRGASEASVDVIKADLTANHNKGIHFSVIRNAVAGLRESEREQLRGVIEQGADAPTHVKWAAYAVSKWLGLMRERYKNFLTSMFVKHLSENEHRAISAVLGGRPVESVAKESGIKEAVLKSYLKKWEGIENWGLDDYLPRVERGALRLMERTEKGRFKTVAVVFTPEHAVERAMELTKERPRDLFLDTSVPDYLKDLPVPTRPGMYRRAVSRLQKQMKEELDDINKGLKAQKIIKGVLEVKPTKKVSPFEKPRRDVLRGELDPVPILYAYAHTMETKMQLDPVIDKVQDLIPHLPPNMRTAMIDLIDDTKGRHWLSDQVIEEIAKKFGVTLHGRPFSRFVSNAKMMEAWMKFAYRPIAGVINAASAAGHIWTKVGTKYLAEGARFMRTEEGRRLLDSIQHLLGTDVVTEMSGKTHGKLRWYNPMAVFQLPEKPMRELAVCANYLLAKGKGLGEKEAIEFAVRANWMQNFIYNTAALPRALRVPTGRLLGQFKPYLVQELGFIANLKGAEAARYLAVMATLGGPIGYIATLRTLPVLSMFPWWGEIEEYVNTQAPRLSRGAPGFMGVDISAPATFQFPASWEDWMGPFLSDLVKLKRTVLDPMARGEFLDPAEKVKELSSKTIPIARHWWEAIDQAIDKDGWVKNDRGQRIYHIGDSPFDKVAYSAKLFAGATDLQKSMISKHERYVKEEARVRARNKQQVVDEVLDALNDGEPLTPEMTQAMMELNITSGSLRRAMKFRMLDSQTRRYLMTEVVKRPELLQEWPMLQQ